MDEIRELIDVFEFTCRNFDWDVSDIVLEESLKQITDARWALIDAITEKVEPEEA